MTTLAIMATYEKKRLKCYGTVAAGEHVAVTITDGAQWIGEGTALRLRVLFGPDTVAVFPFTEGDTWTSAGTQDADAACELNLNTVQAEKYLKHGGTCLWILDDVENHTLYATGKFDVLPWPKRRGIDEPIDLDGYPLLLDEIKDLKEAFEEYQRTVAQMLATKQDTIFDLATIRSGAAAGATAVQPSQIARFVDGAEYRQSYGEQNNPAILFMHGTNVIVALDATPFVKDGMVSSVAVVGGNLVITFNTDSGKQPITVPLTDIFDPANYYDKDTVDNLLDGKQDALTFDNAPTAGSNNPVKSGGIWSAIWGALSALPTGFSSLYDWCVSQLAGKLSLSGGDMTGPITGIRANGDANRKAFLSKISLAAVGVARKGAGNLGICLALTDGTEREASLYIDDNGKVYINTPNGYVEVPNATNGGTLALTAGAGHSGNLAALDAQGNPTDSQIPATNVALKSAIPYALVTKTISNNTVALDDRTSNIVNVDSAIATLMVNFPYATSDKCRDFALLLALGAGVTAPEIAWPQGVTLKNGDGEVPEIADGGTDGSDTILYFSEIAPDVFLVKGETLAVITQA